APPRSTLFPSTTLFRSPEQDLERELPTRGHLHAFDPLRQRNNPDPRQACAAASVNIVLMRELQLAVRPYAKQSQVRWDGSHARPFADQAWRLVGHCQDAAALIQGVCAGLKASRIGALNQRRFA